MNSLQHALRGWPFLLLALALGGFGTKALIDTQRRPEQDGRGGSSMNLDVHASGSSSVAKDGAGGTAEVTLPKDQWGAAGIELAQPKESEFNVPVTLTGKVSLNEDRISHIYPMVDGTVDSVSITLGQNVKADDLLIVVHSREIGQAKLNLYQARLQREIAIVKRDLQTKIAENTRRLIEELRSRRPIQDIEEKFRSLSMGDYRERLLASYANYLKAQADVNRLENVRDSGAVSSKLLLTAQSTRDGDLATFQARIEQIEYEIQTDILAANQTVKEAETRVAVDSTNLRILGVSSEDIESVDPTTQGQSKIGRAHV